MTQTEEILDEMQKNWFTVEAIDTDTFAVSEYGHWEETHCYLLCGSKRAALIDTGLGIADIKKVIDSLTKLPVGIISAGINILTTLQFTKQKRIGCRLNFPYRCKR